MLAQFCFTLRTFGRCYLQRPQRSIFTTAFQARTSLAAIALRAISACASLIARWLSSACLPARLFG